MTAVWMISITVGCAAVIEDLLRRRISNWTSGGALLGGCTLQFIGKAGTARSCTVRSGSRPKELLRKSSSRCGGAAGLLSLPRTLR